MADNDTDDRKQDNAEAEPMLDMSQAAVKRMISEARERGFITYDQLNQVLPPDQVSSEQIEDVMSMLSEMGINIIEEEEAEEGDGRSTELVTTSTSREVALAGQDNLVVEKPLLGRVEDLIHRSGIDGLLRKCCSQTLFGACIVGQ